MNADIRKSSLPVGTVVGIVAAFWLETAAALVMGWRPVGTIEQGGCAALTLAFGAALWLFYPAERRKRLRRWGPELLLLTGSAVIGMAVLELAAANILTRLEPQVPYHTRGANLRLVFRPAPQTMPGLEGTARYSTDARGIRAPLTADARHGLRLVCIGGSTTECTYLDDWETWPSRLMKRLNGERGHEYVWIGGMGVSGYATREHLQLLRAPEFPTGIQGVILQPGINDLWRFLSNEEDQIDLQRFEEQAPGEGSMPAVIASPYKPLWTRSRLVELYHTVQRLRRTPSPEDPAMIESSGGEEYAVRRHRRAQATLTDALPDLTAGIERYRHRVTEIIQTCRSRNLFLAFTTQPVLWEAALPPEVASRCWFGWLPDGRYLTLGAMRRAIDAYNGALKEWCEHEKIACVDLGSMNGIPEYFYDDCHFTGEGAERAAQLIADALGERLFKLPDAPSGNQEPPILP